MQAKEVYTGDLGQCSQIYLHELTQSYVIQMNMLSGERIQAPAASQAPAMFSLYATECDAPVPPVAYTGVVSYSFRWVGYVPAARSYVDQ